MLDAAFIREHLDDVKTNCRNRKVKAEVDRVVQFDDERKRLIQQTQVIQQRQNEVSKLIPKEKDSARKQELIAEGKRLREEVASQEKQLKETQEQLHAAQLTVPNMTHPEAPVGTTAEDNKVIREHGASLASSTSQPRITSRSPRRCNSSISRLAHPWRVRSFITSRTRRCYWNWRWCSTPCGH